MKHLCTKCLLLLFAGMFVFCTSSFAQGTTNAGLNGTVTDMKGTPIFAATVYVLHEPSGTVYGSTSREDGRFNVNGLKVGGPYTVKVSYIGYTTQEQKGLYLELGQTLRIDFRLPETSVQTSEVTIVADRNSVFNENRTGSTQFVSSKNIEELPTISRRFQDFSKLSPLFSGVDLSAAGRNNRYNNIQIDGTQYNDMFGLGSSGTPGSQAGANPISLDAIQEFQVVIAPYDVKLSNFTGGGINAITKSGNNTLTGSAYLYYRNESFVGKSPDALKTKMDDFSELQSGIRLGGPIIEDQLFFFTNFEYTTYTRPTTNTPLVQGDNITAYTQLADRFKSILSAKGMDPGSYTEATLKRPSYKFFARFDWNLSQNHKLTLRHNFVDGSDDILTRGRTNEIFFDSWTYNFKTNTNSTVLQLLSSFGDNMSNELILGYTRIRDAREGVNAPRPEILVKNEAVRLIAGPDRFSSANELDQDIFEITDNFTYYLGDHTLTFGTHNELFSFRNLFVRSFYGYYEFKTLDDLEAGTVDYYQRNFSRTADPNQAAEFSAMQFGVYAQDEWNVLENLKLTFGVRFDIPTFPDTPLANDSVSYYFPGYKTTDVPSGNLLISPRFGFNWDPFGDKTTQVRGGVGLFTGKIPYVWMSNNYGNTGMYYAEINKGGDGLVFSVDPYNQPGVGDPGTGAPRLTSEINLVDPDFKMPQVLRFNGAVDQQLPYGFIGTLEFIYTKAVNDLIYEKINIKNINSPSISAQDGRPIFGGTDSKNNNFRDVLLLANTSEGYSYNFAVQVQRNVVNGLSLNVGYTFGRATDLNSTTSSQAVSQMRYNPVVGSPNSPALATSLYEIQHRVFASVSYSDEFIGAGWRTTISAFYNGQSGQPFSFMYQGDFNKDGFDNNDLFYVPNDDADILLGALTSGDFVPNAQMYTDLNSFINNNSYLSENRGKITERNGTRNPFRHVIDLRIIQDLPVIEGHRFQVSLDILNVLNLLNSEWGWDEYVFSTYNVVNYLGNVTVDGPNKGKPVYKFTAPANNVPWAASNISSRWAMQFGVRYFFN